MRPLQTAVGWPRSLFLRTGSRILREALWPPGAPSPADFRDVHVTLRPGCNDPWKGRTREGLGSMGGDRDPAVGDTIQTIRIIQRRNHLTRHEIHYRNGSVTIVDHLVRPYQREGGPPPRRSQWQPLHESAPLFPPRPPPYSLFDPSPRAQENQGPLSRFLVFGYNRGLGWVDAAAVGRRALGNPGNRISLWHLTPRRRRRWPSEMPYARRPTNRDLTTRSPP